MVPSGWMEITRMSALAEGGLTARRTGRAGAKAGQSDPTVPSGRAVAYRIKATPGITGLSCPSVHSDGKVWHLDVGSSHPGAGVGNCSPHRQRWGNKPAHIGETLTARPRATPREG